MPVGLVKARNPLGHSGHRRLQEVVGSKEIEIGNPHWIGLPVRRLSWKLEYTFNAFQTLLGVMRDIKFRVSFRLNPGIGCKINRMLLLCVENELDVSLQ
jgi:hypothetical protein